MTHPSSSSKIQSLEKELKEKNRLIKEYELALKDSNERIQKILQTLQNSSTLIRNIHKSLLPATAPKIPHFGLNWKLTPTRSGVSGDFFDVIRLNQPLLFGVLLCSGNSYTATASFLSVFLKFLPTLKEHKTPDGFFSELSENLFPSLPEKDTLDIFYGIVNRRDWTLNYRLTGDMFAGVQSSASNQVNGKKNFRMFQPSRPGGKGKKSSVIELNPKDCIVLCSPGVAQRKNLKGESFGEKNIIQSISLGKQKSALSARQSILFQADRFAGSAEPERDQTVLILTVKDRILRLTKKPE